jgi:hypothetical protein
LEPRTNEGRLLKNFDGPDSGTDCQLIRVELESTGDVSMGFDPLRASTGSRVVFERRRVSDEVWLPSELEARGWPRAARQEAVDAGCA